MLLPYFSLKNFVILYIVVNTLMSIMSSVLSIWTGSIVGMWRTKELILTPSIIE